MKNEEKAKLGTLLKYWIEHSQEHSQEFKEWADRVRDSGDADIAGEMLQAVGDMDKAIECLSRALKGLGEKEG
jgi:hypothetical protein